MIQLAGLRDLYAGSAGRTPATLFLCCNGPSLADVDLEPLRAPGIVTMGVNNGGHLIRPRLWACVDHPARFMTSIWQDPAILKFFPSGHAKKAILDHATGEPGEVRVDECPGVVAFHSSQSFQPARWLADPRVAYGQKGERFCVMLAALKVAYVLGFRRVFLLGVDWEFKAATPYFFDEERDAKHERGNRALFAIVSGYLLQLRPYFERAGFQVYNCNPRSGLTVFPHWPLERALESARVDVSASTRGMYVPRG